MSLSSVTPFLHVNQPPRIAALFFSAPVFPYSWLSYIFFFSYKKKKQTTLSSTFQMAPGYTSNMPTNTQTPRKLWVSDSPSVLILKNKGVCCVLSKIDLEACWCSAQLDLWWNLHKHTRARNPANDLRSSLKESLLSQLNFLKKARYW